MTQQYLVAQHVNIASLSLQNLQRALQVIDLELEQADVFHSVSVLDLSLRQRALLYLDLFVSALNVTYFLCGSARCRTIEPARRCDG